MARVPITQAASENCEDIAELKDCIAELKNAERVCPVEVGELEQPQIINVNTAQPQTVNWGGFQPNNSPFISTSGTQIEITSPEVCKVHVTASILMANTDGGTGATGNAQRAHPEMWIMKNGEKFAAALHTYIRDANGHDASSANADRWDVNPQVGDIYTLMVQGDKSATAGSGQSTATVEILQANDGDNVLPAQYLQAACFIEVRAW